MGHLIRDTFIGDPKLFMADPYFSHHWKLISIVTAICNWNTGKMSETKCYKIARKKKLIKLKFTSLPTFSLFKDTVTWRNFKCSMFNSQQYPSLLSCHTAIVANKVQGWLYTLGSIVQLNILYQLVHWVVLYNCTSCTGWYTG